MANAYFDAAYYLNTYPDLAPHGVTLDTAWEHYVQYGAAEGRQPNAWFDGAFYLAAYADLASVSPIAALAHYVQYGAAEGRKPIAWFDAVYYASTNADVANALGITDPAALTLNNVHALFAHFYHYGAAEFRAPQAGISYDLAGVQAYVTANQDVANACGISNPGQITPEQVLVVVRHFFEFGLKEGRPAPLAVVEPTSGGTFVLTTAQQTLAGTAGDDVFKGVSFALAAERTLRADDQLDGGAGRDTLQVDVKNDFGGFTGNGKAENIEVIDLINNTKLDRGFNATGVKGADTYNIHSTHGKTVSLTNVANDGITINLNGVKSATSMGFAKNDHKALTLGLNNVGTAADAKATPAVAESAVVVTAAGIEALTVNATGVNVVSLAAAATKTITLAGEGSAKVNAVSTGVTSVDASGLKGTANLNLTATTALAAVKTGAGDDHIAAKFAGLKAGATIDGGEGRNTLNLTVGHGVAQYGISNIQTMQLNGGVVGDAFTFSGVNASGIETVQLATDFAAGTATLYNVVAGDLAITVQGGAAGKLVSFNAGATSISVTGAAAETSTSEIDLFNAGSVSLNVAATATFNGKISAADAASVAVALAGKMGANAEISAAAAQSVVISQVEKDTDLTLKATAATLLAVTATNNLAFNAASDLGAVQAVSVNTGGHFFIGALAAANSVTLSGTGSATLGDLGVAGLQYGLSVTASQLSNGGLTLNGDLKAGGNSLTLDASGLQGAVTQAVGKVIKAGSVEINVDANTVTGATFGNIIANSVNINAINIGGAITQGTIESKDVVYKGANLYANKVVVNGNGATTVHVDVTGGLGADQVTVSSSVAVNVKGDLGIGNNVVTINAIAAGSTINASGLTAGSAGKVSLNGATGADTIIGTAGNDTITGGAGADTMTGGAGADTFVFKGGHSLDDLHSALTSNGVAAGDSLDFPRGADVITDFNAAQNDKLDVTATEALKSLMGVRPDELLTNNTPYVAYGTWNSGMGRFTIAEAFNAASANDALLITNGAGKYLRLTTDAVVLENLGVALAPTDFV